MKVVFFSIVLDGMPWITFHYPMLRTLPFPWEWYVMEGVAAPVHCSKWCRPLPPRLSNDGTTEYLDSLSFDPRIHLHRRKKWQGKIEMVNTPLPRIAEPCLLWEIDSDEVWTASQITTMRRMFLQDPSRTSAQFYCRYFVGPDLITTTPGTYGNRDFDWHRVWRFTPGMRFTTHEPPVLSTPTGAPLPDRRFTQLETSSAGLIFDHFAYATRATVEFKSKFYGRNGTYTHAVEGWERLQRNQTWPARLSDYFRWVDDNTLVTRL